MSPCAVFTPHIRPTHDPQLNHMMCVIQILLIISDYLTDKPSNPFPRLPSKSHNSHHYCLFCLCQQFTLRRVAQLSFPLGPPSGVIPPCSLCCMIIAGLNLFSKIILFSGCINKKQVCFEQGITFLLL